MVSQSLQEVIKVTHNIENSMQLVIGLRFHSFAIKDVDHWPDEDADTGSHGVIVDRVSWQVCYGSKFRENTRALQFSCLFL